MAFEDIIQLLMEKDYGKLKQQMKDMQTPDIAEFLDELDPKNALIVFRLLPKGIAAEVFSYLSSERRSDLSLIHILTIEAINCLGNKGRILFI